MPHPHISKKPEEQPTRGKTASNRLRRVDNFILLYEPSLLTQTDGLFAFFEAWKESAAETSAMKAFGARQWFVNSAESLARKGYQVNLQKKFLSRGYLIWEL